MSSDEYGRIVSKNLRRIAIENDKQQSDVAKDLGLSKATVSSWFNGTRVPRMDKIDALCKYFHCKRSDIIEEFTETMRDPLSTDEWKVMDAYRAADPVTRRNIRMILGLTEEAAIANKIS